MIRLIVYAASGINTKLTTISLSKENKKKLEDFTAASWNGEIDKVKAFIAQPELVKFVNQPNKRGTIPFLL